MEEVLCPPPPQKKPSEGPKRSLQAVANPQHEPHGGQWGKFKCYGTVEHNAESRGFTKERLSRWTVQPLDEGRSWLEDLTRLWL